MIAYDKPAGLPVVRERGESTGAGETLMGLVQKEYGRTVVNAHRLDTEVSGVLLCAKDKASLDYLSGQFQSKSAQRILHALCLVLPLDRCTFPFDVKRNGEGALPDEFDMDMGLDEDPRDPSRVQIFRRKGGGKACATSFRTLERFGRYALVECRPETGRRHQLQVHLAGAGAPLLNDLIYGDPEEKLLLSGLKRGYKGRVDEKPLIRRLALHAASITLKHPGSKEPICVQAPEPEDFSVALKYLRKFAAR